ncbi:hypothetical protein BV25DRAFT_1963906 [Artomyces pyxidatus]|uniref:Uncharacterized protein n=1 Tax=Artomyces pyxidatus TaxID=48021 RepID=A0ACB8SSM0_9AGAM|nr:hypothetical protein BV25DRAFT_1963906 [Artomyces pyxidatus]
MTSLTDLPAEIIDAIASWIDAQDDVYAFALSSTALARVVSPRHTQLRKLTCRISEIGHKAWTAFAETPCLACQVRVLEIVPNSHWPWVPPSLRSRSHPDAEDVFNKLALALRNMHNLERFSFEVDRTGCFADDPNESMMWSDLASSCINISEVFICEMKRTTRWESAVFTMSNLVVFEYTALEGLHSAQVNLVRLGVMLRDRCPNLHVESTSFLKDPSMRAHLHLQKLRIEIDGDPDPNLPDIGPLILAGRWPHLVALCLHNIGFSAPDAIVSFLSFHSRIRELHLDSPVGSDGEGKELPLMCPPELLPALVVLVSTPGHIVDTMSSRSPESTLKDIRTLEGPRNEELHDLSKILVPGTMKGVYRTSRLAFVASAVPINFMLGGI